MDRRPPPVEGIRDQTVLDWVMVDVIDVASQILVVSDQVFPEAPLPEVVFAAPIATERHTLAQERARKSRLDRPPASREVSISFRQRP